MCPHSAGPHTAVCSGVHCGMEQTRRGRSLTRSRETPAARTVEAKYCSTPHPEWHQTFLCPGQSLPVQCLRQRRQTQAVVLQIAAGTAAAAVERPWCETPVKLQQHKGSRKARAKPAQAGCAIQHLKGNVIVQDYLVCRRVRTEVMCCFQQTPFSTPCAKRRKASSVVWPDCSS